LILIKIIKTVVRTCQILGLKCTKFDIGWGSSPDYAGGAYSALREGTDPLAGGRGLPGLAASKTLPRSRSF